MYINQKQDPHLGLPLFIPVHVYRTTTREPHFLPITRNVFGGVSIQAAIEISTKHWPQSRWFLSVMQWEFEFGPESQEAKSRCRSRHRSRTLSMAAGSLWGSHRTRVGSQRVRWDVTGEHAAAGHHTWPQVLSFGFIVLRAKTSLAPLLGELSLGSARKTLSTVHLALLQLLSLVHWASGKSGKSCF